MTDHKGLHSSRREKYFKKFEETSPALALGLIIVSCGLYIINWIYVKNRDIEEYFEEAPDSPRGLVILMLLPFSWFFLMLLFKELIFTELPLIIGIIEIVVWGLLIFLIYKYLYDFCNIFGKVTHSSGIVWFVLFIIGGLGVLSYFLEWTYLVPLIFFLSIPIPAMQSQLNVTYKSLIIRGKHRHF